MAPETVPLAAASVAVAQVPVANPNPAKTTTPRKRAPAPPPFSDASEPAGVSGDRASPPALELSASAAASPRPDPEPTTAAPAAALGPVGPRTPPYAPTPAARARTVARTTESADAGIEPALTPGPAVLTRLEAERAAIVPLLEPSGAASLPATPWAPLEEPALVLTGRPYQRHLASDEGGTPPSAYRPPSQAIAMATAAANEANEANAADRASASMDDPGATSAGATVARHANRLLDSITDPARFVEIAGWFVIVGAAMSLLGFLLPWSRVVIGASAVGGYFDGWGLASPTHLVVFIGLLAILALAILRDPVPAWISSGILGLAFGALLVGLAWPYLVGPLGSDVGLTMTTLGGIALITGGVVALWATRHVAVEPLV